MNATGRVRSMDGGELAILERTEGEGPLLVFCHATGFCKEVWLPVIDDLASRSTGWKAIAIDQRMHGESRGFPATFDWWLLGHDVLSVVGDRQPVVAVGHSGGGAAVVMAELLRPGALAAAVLVEPIIPPPPYLVAPSHPLAEAAVKRRRRFESRQAAFASYRGRGPFAGWDDRVLRAYIDGGFREEAGHVVLRGVPESEAEFFLHSTAHGAWDRLGELDIPVTLIAGEHSDTHSAGFLRAQAARIPSVATEIVPGASHFVPMQRPGLVADRITDVLAELS